jgi:phage N-6-adenine-methyltransferase
MLNNSMMTSAKGDWKTPRSILEPLTDWFEVDLDPCAGPDTFIGKTDNFRGLFQDGLALPWGGTCFVNPPYGRGVGKWVAKCETEYRLRYCEVIALLPARTDTGWWQECWKADAICFIRGRIKFVGAESSAPFPSALVYWGDRVGRFSRAFGGMGKVIRL